MTKPLTRLEERILGSLQLGPAQAICDLWFDLNHVERCSYGSVREAAHGLAKRGLVEMRHRLSLNACTVTITDKGRRLCA